MRQEREWLDIMNPKLEALMRHAEAQKICTWDVTRNLDLYEIVVNGFYLTFMKSHKPYGTRCFLLDEDLAKCLGFGTLENLKEVLPIRKSRRFVSLDNLRRAINKYAWRSADLPPMRAGAKKRPRKRNLEKNS